ncbi:MAG TPA: penicillin-binding transpeptidase domain-containing protein, partial [Streptosporangiaceae bacterium]|nr:penicillin-binding transpeptidase domain-containing protein [Streptosporangiaceae bacterium]
YAAAGALTTAPGDQVAVALRSAFGQLDATALFLSMDSVVAHGNKATATFTADVDLAGDGGTWRYQGSFGLVKSDGSWRVSWTPAAIVPGLLPGDRLAVVTAYPPRGHVLNSAGQPLETSAPVYVVGVVPGKLAAATATATAFAQATGVEPDQVSGQIAAAPPGQFLTLASLDPSSYQRLRANLARVPGLQVRTGLRSLYKTVATELVGTVGTEVDPALRAVGAFYVPGETIGLGGLEQAFQRQLLGVPTTEVVVLDPAGRVRTVLYKSTDGAPGQPVHTTIDAHVQDAAIAALGSVPNSGEMVAVQASTGHILAVAQHGGPVPLPSGGVLNGKLSPGTAFTIVSAAALLQSGLAVNTPIGCTNSLSVGGQTFTSDRSGSDKPFSADFADDCGTAFAGLSLRLNPEQFAAVVRGFGLGAGWPALPVPVFRGSVPVASGQADLAAETIGTGNVQVSPLGMALVAAEVDTGSWHPPCVMSDAAAGPPAGAAAPLDQTSLASLRGLMWEAVHSGAASAARTSGPSVFGQVGLTRYGSGSQWLSWFVGYRGDIAFTIVETGSSPRLSAAALAHAFAAALR